METVPKDLRGLRACLVCSLIKVYIIFIELLSERKIKFIFYLYVKYFPSLFNSRRLSISSNLMAATIVMNFYV